MKNERTVVAVLLFALIAVPVSRAEESLIDFDTGLSARLDLTQSAFVAPHANPPAPQQATESTEVLVHRLSDPGVVSLKREIANMPGVSPEFASKVASDKIVILYDGNKGYVTTPAGTGGYYVLADSTDKNLLEFFKKQKLAALPDRQWITKCKPVIKIIWKWIKEAWVAYEITEEICKQEWVDDPAPSNPSPWTPGPGPGAVPPGNPFEHRGRLSN